MRSQDETWVVGKRLCLQHDAELALRILKKDGFYLMPFLPTGRERSYFDANADELLKPNMCDPSQVH